MFCLGMTVVEIMNNCPIWQVGNNNYIFTTGRVMVRTGCMSNNTRNIDMLISTQAQFCQNIPSNLKKLDKYNIARDEFLLDLTEKMLSLNPLDRISPNDILIHPFIKNLNEDE